jgi:hypothetical protein
MWDSKKTKHVIGNVNSRFWRQQQWKQLCCAALLPKRDGRESKAGKRRLTRSLKLLQCKSQPSPPLVANSPFASCFDRFVTITSVVGNTLLQTLLRVLVLLPCLCLMQSMSSCQCSVCATNGPIPSNSAPFQQPAQWQDRPWTSHHVFFKLGKFVTKGQIARFVSNPSGPSVMALKRLTATACQSSLKCG